MTWIRFECDCPEDPLWEELAGSAGCNRATAFLAYWTMVARMAKAHPSGQLDRVSDAQVEAWAGWRGKAGRWARAIRRRCQEPAEGDYPGMLRGWWRNEAPLQKQLRDAQKRRGNRSPERPEKSSENASSEARPAAASPKGPAKVNTLAGHEMREKTPEKPVRVSEGFSPEPPKNPRGFLEGTPEKPAQNPRATVDKQTPSKSLRSLEGVTPAESGGVTPPRWPTRVTA